MPSPSSVREPLRVSMVTVDANLDTRDVVELNCALVPDAEDVINPLLNSVPLLIFMTMSESDAKVTPLATVVEEFVVVATTAPPFKFRVAGLNPDFEMMRA